jgi:fatty acid synthase
MFLQETSFHGVMLDKVFSASPELKKILHDIMTEGILSGVVRPLKRTMFPSTEVEQAFRCACHYRNITRMTAEITETAVLLHSFLVLNIC